MKPAGILLAGGLARRMGGGDKGFLIVGGHPILAQAIRRFGLQVAALALNANGDAARFAEWALPVVPDTVEGYPGPLAGILAGMEWVARNHPQLPDVVSAPTDAPFLPVDLVDRLYAARAAAGAEIAMAASGGRTHPVVALWPVRLAAQLRRALAEEGLRKVEDFAARYSVAIAQFSVRPADPFFNVNSPEDLAAAEHAAQEI